MSFFGGVRGGEVSLVCEEFFLCFCASIVYVAIYEFHWRYDDFIGTFKDSIMLERFHGALKKVSLLLVEFSWCFERYIGDWRDSLVFCL